MSSQQMSPSASASQENAPSTWKVGQDAAIAFGLVIALAVVMAFDSTRAPVEDGASQDNGILKEPTVVVENVVEEPASRPQKLAVTPAEYDDIGRLLKDLGEAYHYDTINLNALLSYEELSKFDIVFLTCGTVPEEWLGDLVGKGTRAGTEVRQYRPEMKERVDKALRRFVENGGTLYASDWRFNLVASAFPEFVDRASMAEGAKQEIQADVVDGGLAEILGSAIKLHFDQEGWNPAAFRGGKVTTYLRGSFQTLKGDELLAPLLVKFPVKEGTVIFTSFHNEKQNSETEIELLRYLVFTAVTARVESQVAKTMIQGGFSPARRSLLSASGGKLSVTKTYTCKRAGKLRFALGFEKRGAGVTLELKISGPNSLSLKKQGTSTFHLEVPNAVPGEYRYTVTALKAPDAVFPFTLTVGEKR